MKLKLVKQTGFRHILLIATSILLVLLVLLIKDTLKSNNDLFHTIIGFIIIVSIVILPFLKGYNAVGMVDLRNDRLILNYDKGSQILEYHFKELPLDYLKLKYLGFDGEHPKDALIFGGIFNRYNGVNNYIELSIDKTILSYEIYIKDYKEYQNLISLLQSIKNTGENVYLDKGE